MHFSGTGLAVDLQPFCQLKVERPVETYQSTVWRQGSAASLEFYGTMNML